MAEMSLAHTPDSLLILCIYSNPHPWPPWDASYGHMIEGGKNPNLDHTRFCTVFRHHPEVDSCSTAAPLCAGPEGRVAKKIPHGGTLSSAPSCLLSLERKCVDYQSTEVRRLVLMVWLNDQGLGRNMI